MNDRILGLLGIARRASKVSLGHDAAMDAVHNGSAWICLTASDASERLKHEFTETCAKTGGRTNIILTEYTMDEIGMCQGAKKTAVMTVNDKGLALKIKDLFGRETDI